jgi:hypothetical protein
MARLLALFVSFVFAVAPLFLWAALWADDDVGWTVAVFAIVYLLGAALLACGTARGYGKVATLLRAWGFGLLLAGALANVSLAFILVPLVFLAVFSLPPRRRDSAHA